MKILSKVTNGKLAPSAGKALVEAIKGQEGKVVTISLSAWNRRSVAQNRFWFGVCVPIIVKMFNDNGMVIDDEEAHQWTKEHVWKWTKTVVGPDGRKAIITRSSKELSKGEWEEKLQITRAWAAEYSVHIPMVDEHILGE